MEAQKSTFHTRLFQIVLSITIDMRFRLSLQGRLTMIETLLLTCVSDYHFHPMLSLFCFVVQ